MSKCLLCYEPLSEQEKDYHTRCVKKLYGKKEVPVLDYSVEQLDTLAKEVVSNHITITGVQPKLSMTIKEAAPQQSARFTIVGLWGEYILKPPFGHYPNLPENEDLTMHLASLFKIATVPHGLVRMASGELAYISRRIDRTKEGMKHMEDFCQLSGRLTEDKYKGSMEQLAGIIDQYSSRSGFDKLSFFEVTIFCFLIGNADMHRKNFSLFYNDKDEHVLSPAYDLVNTKLAMPEDLEEMALMINGKKRKFKRKDFEGFGEKIGLSPKQIENTFKRFIKLEKKTYDWVQKSFLTQEQKVSYQRIMAERFGRLKG